MSGVMLKSITPIEGAAFKLNLVFVAGPDVPDYKDPAYQQQLHSIQEKLKAPGNKVQARAKFSESRKRRILADWRISHAAFSPRDPARHAIRRLDYGQARTQSQNQGWRDRGRSRDDKEDDHLLDRARAIKAEADKSL